MTNYHFKDNLDDTSYQDISKSIVKNPFRRLNNKEEFSIPNRILCQSIHINNFNGSAKKMVGSEKSSYSCHSLESAKGEIEKLLSLGIEKVFIQLLPINESDSINKKIDDFTKILLLLRQEFKDDLTILVDPQGVCMRSDLRWGVSGPRGEIDAEETLNVLAKTALEFGKSGINGFVNLGRLNFESKIVKSVFDKNSLPVKVMSFSTNSETANAYIQETSLNPKSAVTGQKILVGNASEMVLRALMDIEEGVDIVIQKPIENFHILQYLQLILKGKISPEEFLQDRCFTSFSEYQFLEKRLPRLAQNLSDKLNQVSLGAYEVSGTYSIFKMLEDKVPLALVFTLLDELYKNAFSAGGDLFNLLIGRNVSWYVAAKKEFT